MKRIFTSLALLAFLPAYGRSQSGAPSFEVASITPCKPGTPAPPGEHAGMVQFIYPGGRFNAKATTVAFLLEWAYGILPSQHSGGPSWLDSERYDIVAKAPGPVTDDEMKRLAQTLLADRFQLKFHRETKEISVLAVSLGKTAPKLFPPKEDEKHSIRIQPQMGDDQKIAFYHIAATRFSFAQLNQTFAWQLGRPILNETGMDGDYDFSFDLTPDESRPNPLDPSLILSAMRDQLGLVVKSQKAPVDFIVVDSAVRVEAGN